MKLEEIKKIAEQKGEIVMHKTFFIRRDFFWPSFYGNREDKWKQLETYLSGAGFTCTRTPFDDMHIMKAKL